MKIKKMMVSLVALVMISIIGSAANAVNGPDEKIVLPSGLRIEYISGDAACYGDFDFSALVEDFDFSALEAIDFGALEAMADCTSECGDDLECMMGCFEGMSGFLESIESMVDMESLESIVSMAGAFYLALRLVNSTTHHIIFIIEPGTIFIPGESGSQTMISIQGETLVVPPGSEVFCIPVYCLDSALGAPSEEDRYRISASAVIHPWLLEIIDLTEGKQIDQNGSIIQSVIWNYSLSDYDSRLSEDERNSLSLLPVETE